MDKLTEEDFRINIGVTQARKQSFQLKSGVMELFVKFLTGQKQIKKNFDINWTENRVVLTWKTCLDLYMVIDLKPKRTVVESFGPGTFTMHFWEVYNDWVHCKKYRRALK